ncbi:acyclic terpene utilization AtuA family protein [Altererythrobacter indicus]|uniref:Acyclic terpene utilization AtuA family protein n=1 Tax=Altericroceibacterium indicum TaxID=374177 RepID=A0A845AB96_9SPHN|nr:acyclic terpene utilization AtuA family protein [Altericroceibacterium indicum]MXP24448.1 acyclic terpene utilization AtuA family protein [Altericroceibacterium indicum]
MTNVAKQPLRIGAGAGYSGDRIEPAAELAEKGELDFLIFECLAERTIALAQAARQSDPEAGYDPLLEKRMCAVLPAARANGIRIVTNMGAANPLSAARKTLAIAREMGFDGIKIAAVIGDDVLDLINAEDWPLTDREGSSADLGKAILSANAYLGARGIVEALDGGADIVITGRVGDPALFLGPLIHHFQWPEDDWNTLGRGTMIGHMLECAGQLTGGYFADPGIKDVPDLARLGFPIAEVSQDGSAIFSKVEGSGGLLSIATCKEQLLYEILDPSCYLQADVAADFTTARFKELGPNRIAVSGGHGTERPQHIKVSIGYKDGFIGEGQISYAGPGAVARGELAIAIIRERLDLIDLPLRELRCELIGMDATNRTGKADTSALREVRVRVAGRTDTLEDARAIGAEVEALYTNGPLGGGGAISLAREVIAVASTLIPREAVKTSIHYEVA